jgi:hypothetical protein
MVVMTLGAPVGIAILAAAFFFMAFKYREQERFGRFEIFFAMGNLFICAGLFLIYSALETAGDAFMNVVFPLFALMMWIYVFVLIVMFFKLLKNLIWSIWKFKGKGYIDG